MATHAHCPSCGLRYEVEPGFFWGAMYISYAISIATVVTILVATTVLYPSPGYLDYVLNVFLGLALLMPFTFRYARVLMLHVFSGIGYEPDWKKRAANAETKRS